jgi:hypothetical protein
VVALERPGIDALATVVWAQDGRCGLAFDDPIESKRVISLARSGPEPMQPGSFRCYGGTGADADRLSAEQWASAKASASRRWACA